MRESDAHDGVIMYNFYFILFLILVVNNDFIPTLTVKLPVSRYKHSLSISFFHLNITLRKHTGETWYLTSGAWAMVWGNSCPK